MNNKQKMYLGVFMIAVVVLGIMYSMGTFSKKSIMAFDATGNVMMREDIMGRNRTDIDSFSGSIAGKADKADLNAATTSIGTNTSNINNNTSSINNNTNSIGTNTSSINNNTNSIGTNTSSINNNTSSIGTNTSNINSKADMSAINSAVDAQELLSKADRDAIKNFVRSKVVLFDSGLYNAEGARTLGTLFGEGPAREVAIKGKGGPDKTNDQVFIKG